MGERGTFVIYNPRAGRGRVARLIDEARTLLRGRGVVDDAVTEYPGEEKTLARQAIDSGFTTIVVAGGDGTTSNVANAIIKSQAPVCLGIIPGGTGTDLCWTLGITSRSVRDAIDIIIAGRARPIDVGSIEGNYFLNVTGFGFDIAVIEDVTRIPYLRGATLYYYSALRQLFSYEGLPIEVSFGDEQQPFRKHLMLIIANGRRFGGSFRIAPDADVRDGLLDAVSILDAPPLARAKLFWMAAKGAHGASPYVSIRKTTDVLLRFRKPPAYEIDGEYLEAESEELVVKVVEAAIEIITPPLGP